jgi:hypothetical protein
MGRAIRVGICGGLGEGLGSKSGERRGLPFEDGLADWASRDHPNSYGAEAQQASQQAGRAISYEVVAAAPGR